MPSDAPDRLSSLLPLFRPAGTGVTAGALGGQPEGAISRALMAASAGIVQPW